MNYDALLKLDPGRRQKGYLLPNEYLIHVVQQVCCCLVIADRSCVLNLAE